MNLNIAVMGQNGQLARALHHFGLRSDDMVRCYGRGTCDLSRDSRHINLFLRSLTPPDVMIMAAAYTDVDGAENNIETAYNINARAAGILAAYCQRIDIPFLYVSTDYVFDGRAKKPYRPEDTPNPLNVYGASKLAGEAESLKFCERAAIFRTSWVFDSTARNFLTAILAKAQYEQEIAVVMDQVAMPTYAGHLALALLSAAQRMSGSQSGIKGIFHICGDGAPVSRADFAREIIKRATRTLPRTVTIKDIFSREYEAAALRPKFAVLDNSRFTDIFGYKIPDWREGLDAAMAARLHNVGELSYG